MPPSTERSALRPHSARGDRLRVYRKEALRRITTLAEPVRAPVRARLLRRAVARDATALPGPVLFLLVYRHANAARVQDLLKQLGPGADVRLWALDQVSEDLRPFTIGCGAGGRFDNLNALVEARAVRPGSWLVVADDDVLFVKGDVGRLLQLMGLAGLSLAQPGHSLLGWWTQPIALARPFAIAGDTNHVEIGPLFAADWAFAQEILPFPRNAGMGWGIEAGWYERKRGRYRIGVIDACRIVHLGRGYGYASGVEDDRMAERLHAAGITSPWQLQTVNRRWWRWQRRPPWDGTPPR